MRILMVNDSAFELGGAERYAFSLASLLQEAGHDVEILGKSGLPGKTVVLTRLYNPVWSHRVAQAIEGFNPDIVHAHHVSFILSPSVLRAARRKRVPVVMTMHDFHMVCPISWFIHRDRKPCPYGFGMKCFSTACIRRPYHLYAAAKLWLHRKLIARYVDCFVSPSRTLAHWLEANAGLGRVEVVPNFVDMSGYSTVPVPENNIILFVGRLHSAKGVECLLKAMPLILSEVPDARLVIVGEGEEGGHLMQLCGDLGVSDRVEFAGWKKGGELGAFYEASQLFCFPSIWMENCPLVLLESIARRRPAVASDIGGVPELVRDGETGLLFRPGDHEDLADKTIRLLKDFPLCQSMAEELGRISGLYSAEHHLERILAVYESCLR
jgi:glycosyltransferase involved in cell wall biosynthesis